MFHRAIFDEQPVSLFSETQAVSLKPGSDGSLSVFETQAYGEHNISTRSLYKEIRAAVRVDLDVQLMGERVLDVSFLSPNGFASQQFNPTTFDLAAREESSVHAIDASITQIDKGQLRIEMLFVGSNLSQQFAIRLALGIPDDSSFLYEGDPRTGLLLSRCRIRSLGL